MDERYNGSIGIAIAAHNSSRLLPGCLEGLRGYKFFVVLFDDGSTDCTRQVAMELRPDIHVVMGDGTAWWGGGTAVAVEECFRSGCKYVLMLNPDTYISGKDILNLVEYVVKNPRTIAAALVVDFNEPDKVAWAGSRTFRIPFTPIFTSRYIAKKGSRTSELGNTPWFSDEAHGRGVLLSRQVYDEIGGLDYRTFPHYGGDVDYSLRARKAGIEIVVLPTVRAKLFIENSGMVIRTPPWTFSRLGEVLASLEERKSGESRRVLWRLHRKHLPPYAVHSSYIFGLLLLIFRRLTRS